MPEGPEIRRAADRIERAVAGQPARQVFFAFPSLKRHQRSLSGDTVSSLETRGKAMLIHFEGGLSVYSHNQLYGRWYVVNAGQAPRTGRTLRFAIHTQEKSALLYSASEIAVMPTEDVGLHPFLAKLGPDALAASTTDAVLARQVADPRFARRQLHALLLDQAFVAGIGNYLRSEILFVAGLHPTLRPQDLTSVERRRLARVIRRVTHRAYRTGGITNDERRARRLKAEGLRKRDYRHHIFVRGGQPCWACDTEIVKLVLNSRKIFVCPTCQPKPDSHRGRGRPVTSGS